MIAENLQKVHQQIKAFEALYHREPHSVTLLAVSKQQSLEKIQEAIHAGQFAFGENYLQEAISKIEKIQDPRIEWHFIGDIQRNKTRKIAEHFSWVQSVESDMIAQRLNDQRPEHLPPLNICLQVNISQESSKSGIHPPQLQKLAEYCLQLPRLKLRGLMAIPALSQDFMVQRAQFALLHQLFEQLNSQYPMLDTLSMGMSSDMESAIAEGSTMVRIGTAIFGSRF